MTARDPFADSPLADSLLRPEFRDKSAVFLHKDEETRIELMLPAELRKQAWDFFQIRLHNA